MRWLEDMGTDLQKLKVKRQREKTIKRKEWACHKECKST
jgi:hypothetical protein